jgi:hypothetical protein
MVLLLGPQDRLPRLFPLQELRLASLPLQELRLAPLPLQELRLAPLPLQELRLAPLHHHSIAPVFIACGVMTARKEL